MSKINKSSLFRVIIIISTGLLTLASRMPQGWREPLRFEHVMNREYSPAIATKGDTIHMVFNGSYTQGIIADSVWYRRSTDDGFTWKKSILISDMPSNWSDCKPPSSITASVTSNYVHIAYAQKRDSPTGAAVKYRRSPDGGETWESIQTLDIWTTRLCACPQITIGPFNTVHLVYMKAISSTQFVVMYTHSCDNGAPGSWSVPEIVTQPTGNLYKC